jgi:acyl carrier protein
VGVHDNFFEIGGHSLKAMRVIFQLRERLDLELPVRQLFSTPTIAGLAVAVVAQMAELTGPEALSEAMAEAGYR